MTTVPISHFELADNENIVRVYETTALARWFWQEPVIGYITVTDKRVLYHSQSRSPLGGTKLLSEIPVDDVSGLSAWMGNSFSWWGFLLFCAAMYLGTILLANALPGLFFNWPVALVLVTPYVIYWLFKRNILSAEIREQLLENLKPVTQLSFLQSKDESFYERIFMGLFLVGMIPIVSNIANSISLGFIIQLAFYFLVYRLFFGNTRTFKLSINSKSAKGSGITVNSGGLLSKFGVDATAAQTLTAAPAADAEQVAHELGALILDIQQLGHMAVSKWKKS